MGMGIVSDEDFNSQLSNLVPSSSKPKVDVDKTDKVKSEPSETDSLQFPDSVPTSQPIQSRAKVVDIKRAGRNEGDVNVPESLRKLVASTAIVEGRQDAVSLAREFGISPSSVSAYTHGATSTASYDKPNPDLLTHNDGVKERISKKARRKLILALNSITEDKLSGAKLKDIAGVARDMAGIMKDMEPAKDAPKENSGPTFVFFKPEVKSEEGYKIVHARD